ncbi:sugar phosphate isomerase/epimerase family protein [Candidatus Palauibacter sp.]|uniref:sugar phosphate isomerase/epimerase family protein n=1 Tax=Candidatus Palauibacter sp. TaxID=3101350 RepID=UPI003D104F97
MDRRRFVRNSLGAGLLLTHAGRAAAADARSLPEAWGLQLYTVRSLMARDVERTLAAVARIGYGEVEFAGYFDRSPAEIRTALEAEGLTAPAAHLSLEELRSSFDEAADAAAEIGHRYLVLPFLGGSERPGGDGATGSAVVDGYRRLADEFNELGARCREAGLVFGYHNHDFELEEVDGLRLLDVMIENTDPELVCYELDFYWLVHGGADPFDYFSRYPGRFDLCHVKDRTADGEMADVGAGEIDFEAIFARSDEAGLIHYFVEHDAPGDPMGSVRASYEHLASFGG